MNIAYSTISVEPFRRFEYWIDVVCQHCVPASSKQLKDKPFDGQLVVNPVGSVEITKMVAPLHSWSRDEIHLRRGPDDDLWIAYMESGQGILSQGGREARLVKGDLVLYDAARPFKFTLETEAEGIYLIRLPRHSLVHRCPGAERLTARVIDNCQVEASPLRSMILQATTCNFDKMRSGAAAQFGSTLLDLAAITLEFQISSAKPVYERSLYDKMIAYIQKHIEDPDLCLADLAEAHCVSPRTVTRIFASRRQTAISMVWKLRLEAAQEALIEGRARSVTVAAFDYGFSDVSHFSRAFRKAFGYAPSSLIRN